MQTTRIWPFPCLLSRLNPHLPHTFLGLTQALHPKFSREFQTLPQLNSDFTLSFLQNSLENFIPTPILSASFITISKHFSAYKTQFYVV